MSPAASSPSLVVVVADRRLQLAVHRRPDAAGAGGALRRAGARGHRARPVFQGAAHRQRHLLDKRILDLENPGAGGDRLRPEAARGRCLRPLPHRRSAALLSDGRLDRGRQLAACRRCSTRRCAACSARPRFTQVVRDERAAADGARSASSSTARRRPSASRWSTCASAAPTCRSRTARRSISACRPSASARRPSSAPRAASAAQEIRAEADRDVTVLVAEATAKARADPRRGRRRAQPHLRRGLQQGSGLLRLLSLDAGLRDRACGTTTRACVLQPDSDFFRYFVDPTGKPRDSPAAAAS